MTKQWIPLLTQLFVAGLVSGCACLEQRHGTTPVGTERQVFVGGAVRNPGKFQIPEDGTTLRQALIQAGDGAPQVADNPNDIWFVTLHRKTERYSFPLPLVLRTAVGQFDLQAGDEVTIENWNQTSLAREETIGRQASFTVTGLVEKPGTYSPPSPDLVQLADRPFYAGSIDTRFPPTVIVLTRSGDSPLERQHFFLPDVAGGEVEPKYLNGAQMKTLLEATIHAGDELAYTRLELTPVVLSTLLTQIVGESERKMKCLEELRAEHQQNQTGLAATIRRTPVIGPAQDAVQRAWQTTTQAIRSPLGF